MSSANQQATYHLRARRLLRSGRIKSPFLMLDTGAINHALGYFNKYLPTSAIYYAVKANPAPELLKYFSALGLKFDVASRREIESVMNNEVSGDKLMLSTPIKTPDTIAAMFDYEIAACAVDTVAELRRIEHYRRRHALKHRFQIFVRIRVDSTNVEVNLNTKFGCAIPDALLIIDECKNLGYPVAGISFHVGTQSKNADNYFIGIQSAMMVAHEALRRFNLKIPIINIGGGFCDPEFAQRNAIDLDLLYQSIGSACQAAITAGFQIYAEPGRALVSSAGALVTTIVGTTTRNNQKWAFLDDGIYGCFSIKMYENHPFDFQVLPSVRTKQADNNGLSKWTIAGPTCDSLDVVAENIELPANLQPGDVLVVPNLGAYTLATASSFNGFDLPQCVLVRSPTTRTRATDSQSKNLAQGGEVIAFSQPGRERRKAAA